MTGNELSNIAELIEAQAIRDPDGTALTGAGAETQRWSDVSDRIARLSRMLRADGLAPHDRVALLAPNGPEFFEILFAIANAGLIAVPLNYRLHPEELAFQLSDSDARQWLVHPTFAEVAQQTRSEIDPVVFDVDRNGPWWRKVADTEPAPRADVTRDDVAGIFYTGGTTGRPKGVQLMHGNLLANAENVSARFDYRPSDVYLHAAPMFHLADLGATMAQLMIGGAHCFLPAFSPQGLAEAVRANQATVTTLAPTMVDMLLRDPDIDDSDLRTLRLVLYGGGPIGDAVLKRAMERLNCGWLQGYGQTEATHTVCFLGPEAHREALSNPKRLRSCGKPIDGVDIRIANDTGDQVPTGEIGELQVKGGTVMKGYWRRPIETEAAFADGWLRTGDLARRDADGFVYLIDRKKDMIVSGGENVYSAEVENVLAGCPGVAEAAVIGVPDAKWGERVHAVVVATAGAALDDAAIVACCREHLAGYKVPRSVDFVEALPKTGAGKIAKSELRRPYWADQPRNVS